MGVRPKIFSIGYGKGRIKKTIGDTTYQVTAFPLGGYVQFYGDDITKKHEDIKPGDFFSVGPWKRIMIALGGPFFSVLLGLIVIFALLLLGWQPPTNKIKIDNTMESPPAAEVLRNGDKILDVNGFKTRSFEEVLYAIVLAPKNEIDLTFERDAKTIQKTLVAKKEEGAPLRIGIQPYGKSSLLVRETKKINDQFALLPGDKILSAKGIPVETVVDLRNVTNANMDKSITLEISRKHSGLFESSSDEERLKVQAPVKRVDYISFSNILHKGKDAKIAPIDVGPWYGEYVSTFDVGGENYNSWDEFEKAVRYHTKNSKTDRLKMVFKDEKEIDAKVSFKQRGILGIRLTEHLVPEKANLPTDFFSLITRTMSQAYLTTKGTLIGLYRIFEGKLSLRQNASGPIKIFDYARKSVRAGWDVYWFLLANITIILGIMNLLPIPILDGGHVLFYLIEGVYKPLPVKVIAIGVRLGFVVLLTFGLYIISIDIWDVVIKKFY